MQKEIEFLRRKFRNGRTALFRQVDWTSPSGGLLEAHASLVDEIIRRIYAISCESADRRAPRHTNSALALVATGGYGRKELNPFSDIDIAFIPSEEEDPWVEAAVHTAFKLVMDVFLSLRDVHVGYSFRPVAEASSWDVATKTALLDLRYVCGDMALARLMQRRVREVLSPLDLMIETQSATNGRQKPARTLYLVEPNLKEGPGSLRDLHRARWIFQLMFSGEEMDLETAMRTLAGISNRRIAEVRAAADWFLRARTWMHLTAGRLSDVLITNYQDRIARELGDCSAQEWLSKHMFYSEILARFRETAVVTLLRGPFSINGVLLKDGSLHLPENSTALNAAVGMFQLSQRYSIPVNLKDLERLAELREQMNATREPSKEEAWAFKRILGEGRDVAHTLRTLSDLGFLDRFIPDFSLVMRFVPPDPAHRYTVGEHSVRMVEHLELLRSGADAAGRRFTDLIGQCAHFDILCLAALLHDAGKLLPGGDHSETGAELAKTVAARLNLAPEKSELLDILVRQHLLLVRTARLHDLKSAPVIQMVAERLRGPEALRHLYVLTYVDTCAVSEGNWTSMDVRNMEDLYRRIQEFFDRPDETQSEGAQEDQAVRLRKKLAALQTTKTDAAVLKHCDAMPAGYVLNTPLEEISFHLQLLDRLEAERVVLDVYNQPGEDYTELTVCAYDDPKPGILAKITGILYGCNADIHRAQAFTLEKEPPVVLDTLWIRSNGAQISENRARRIRTSLKDALTGAKTVERFLEEAGKNPPKSIELDGIDMRNDLSEEHTVVHIIAHDLQGLLYIMTRSLSRCGLHIHSAKVATWNARAENNFYVTTAKGSQIPNKDIPLWTEWLERVLSGDGAESSDRA